MFECFQVQHSEPFAFSVLEVYQFARDASVAEAWLIAHEPYLTSTEYGETLDMVEALIKKHEAFEKSAATQEERFAALERLTTVSFFWKRNCVNCQQKRNTIVLWNRNFAKCSKQE